MQNIPKNRPPGLPPEVTTASPNTDRPASSGQDLRGALAEALTNAGEQPDAIADDFVGDLMRGLRGPELDLTSFTGQRAQRLIGMAPSGWVALEQEARSRSPNQHGITSVVLGGELSSGGRIVANLRLLPELEHLHVSVTPSTSSMDFAGLQSAEGSKGIKLFVNGESAPAPATVTVPAGTEIVASPGLRLSVQFLNSDRKVVGSHRIGPPDLANLPADIRNHMEPFLSLKALYNLATTSKENAKSTRNPTVRRALAADPDEVTLARDNLGREHELRTEASKYATELLAAAPDLSTQGDAWAAVANAAFLLGGELGRPEKAIEILRWAAAETTGVLHFAANCMLAMYLAKTGAYEEAKALMESNAAASPSNADFDKYPGVIESMFALGSDFENDMAMAGLLAGDIEAARPLAEDHGIFNMLLKAVYFQTLATGRAIPAGQPQDALSDSDDDDDYPARVAIARLSDRYHEMEHALFLAWSGDVDSAMAILTSEDERGVLRSKALLEFAQSPLANNLRNDDRFLALQWRHNVAPDQLAAIPFEFTPPTTQAAASPQEPASS